MKSVPFLLADVGTPDPLAGWHLSQLASSDKLMIFGAMGLVTLLLVFWAVFLRKKRRRHEHRHHHSHHHASESAGAAMASPQDPAPSTPGKHHRRRHSRRRHRPLNPTLAETGGLPPIRPQDNSDPVP